MKTKTKVLICVLAVLLLLIAALGVWCWSQTAGFYSEKQHLSRVKSLAEERYLGEGSEYTGLEVYPLYNEDDKLEYVLIELQPQGFVYVKVNENAIFGPFGGGGMYTRAAEEPLDWTPYRMVDGKEEAIKDENGEPIQYSESHFKVAGIGDERRYLLQLQTGAAPHYIPAVKRGEQYLDLVDGSLIDYVPGVDTFAYATADILFISAKSYFDL